MLSQCDVAAANLLHPPEHIRSSLTMSKPDPIVSEVSRLASEGQPGSYERAYNALQDGFDKFLENERLCSPTQQVNQEKADQYWKDINSELSSRGFLPGLSVAYLKDNFGRLDTQGRKSGDLPGPDGMLTHSEIRQEEGRNKVFANHFDDMGGKKDFFHDVARMHDKLYTRKEIEHADVEKYLRKEDRQNRKHEKQEANRESMAPLFEGKECDTRTLLEHINSKNRNGRVTVREMEMYLDECARRSNSPDSIYNEKNADYVQGILNGEERWNKAGDGFQINKLARKGNFDALNMTTAGAHEDLKKNYEAAKEVFEEKVAPTDEKFTPKTECEDQEEAAKLKETKEKTDSGDRTEGSDGVYTVKAKQGYWHIFDDLCKQAGYNATNQEKMTGMNALMTMNNAHHADKYPGYAPMLHPGDKVHFNMDKLCAQVPGLKKAMGR